MIFFFKLHINHEPYKLVKYVIINITIYNYVYTIENYKVRQKLISKIIL